MLKKCVKQLKENNDDLEEYIDNLLDREIALKNNKSYVALFGGMTMHSAAHLNKRSINASPMQTWKNVRIPFYR